MPSRPRVLVGKSGSTPCKHYVLDSILGKICGVISTGQILPSSVWFYDLTAGDGKPKAPTEQSLFPDANQGLFYHHCSPGIYIKHSNWLAKQTSVPVYLSLIEKQPVTFDSLRKNVALSMVEKEWEPTGDNCYQKKASVIQLIQGDAKDVAMRGSKRDRMAHIYNDPNHIEDWVLTPEMLASCPSLTTSVSTLGCNVNGLKRMTRERREQWYDKVNELTGALVHSWHDACLFSVGGPDQWAYMITAPTIWRPRITDYCLKAARKIEGRIARPQVVWMKDEPDRYRVLQDSLFLTRKEMGDAA